MLSEPVRVRSRLGSGGRAAASWLTRHRLVLITGLAAALPIIVAVAQRVAVDWVPLGDNAVVAVRALDVLSTHPPLLGQSSFGTSQVLGEDVYSPGPLLFWLLALPARLPGALWLELTVGLVNVASVVGVVALANRRGGRPLMVAVALALALMFGSLPAEALSDIWNASVPLAPFTLLIFLCWSLACGDYRLLPLIALVASLVTQAHLGYIPPALGVVAVGLIGLAASRHSLRRPPVRRWAVAAVLVALICFSAPLVEQAIHRPGNLVLLLRAATADAPTLGIESGWHALVGAVGIPPWWLQDPMSSLERVAELSATPSVIATASAILVLAALGAVCVAGWRRRRVDVVAACALALMLCAALLASTASTPEASFTSVGYTLRWASPAGMWVWLALGWSLATLLRPIRPPAWAHRPAVTLACVAAVAAAGGLVAAGGEQREEPFDEVHAIAAQLEREVPDGPTTRVDVSSTPDSSFIALDLQGAVVYQLRHEGKDVVAPTMAPVLGSHYGSEGDAHDQVLRVDVETPPPDRGKVIARLTVPQLADPGDPFAPRSPPRRSVALTLIRGDEGR